MSRRITKNIDGKMLRKLCDTYASAANTSLAGMSRTMGYSDKFLVNTCNAGQITYGVEAMLDKLFHISPESYAKRQEAEPEPEPAQTEMSINHSADISMAVKAALLDQEVLTELTLMLKAAVRGGMIDAREEMMRRAKKDGGAR